MLDMKVGEFLGLPQRKRRSKSCCFQKFCALFVCGLMNLSNDKCGLGCQHISLFHISKQSHAARNIFCCVKGAGASRITASSAQTSALFGRKFRATQLTAVAKDYAAVPVWDCASLAWYKGRKKVQLCLRANEHSARAWHC